MRTGLAGTRELSKTMPWAVLSNMTDEDLAAILAYLKTLKPIAHRVDNSEMLYGAATRSGVFREGLKLSLADINFRDEQNSRTSRHHA